MSFFQEISASPEIRFILPEFLIASPEDKTLECGVDYQMNKRVPIPRGVRANVLIDGGVGLHL